jgi:hypothetical protein
VVKAIRGEPPDRVPLDGYFRQDVWSRLEEHFGTTDADAVSSALGLDMRYAELEPGGEFTARARPSPWQIPAIGMGARNLVIVRDDGWLEDEYGVCRVPNSTGLYWHYAYHPLAGADVADVRDYHFPATEGPERYGAIRSDVSRWSGDAFVVVELWNIFKSSWELRGFDRYMMDLILEPQLVEILADRVLEHRLDQSRELLRCGVDMIMISGDIAMQDGMMLAPRLWRKVFKPRLQAWLREVRREASQRPERDIFFMFHSDGDMEPIFGDLVDIGFDAIDPVQPECMDVMDISRRFGDRVCLHGTISCQQTLPFGTAAEVEAEVRQRIECCGRDGGLIISPANTIQPDVPLENILALYLTAQNTSLEGDDA